MPKETFFTAISRWRVVSRRALLPNRYNCNLAVRLFCRACRQVEISTRRASRPFVGLQNKSPRPSRISPAHPTV
jgi:hypothetical protein